MTNNKIHYLIEGISKDIVVYLMEEENMDLPDALNLLHNSETFEKLSDISTGLYLESSAYVYDVLLYELKNGKLGV